MERQSFLLLSNVLINSYLIEIIKDSNTKLDTLFKGLNRDNELNKQLNFDITHTIADKYIIPLNTNVSIDGFKNRFEISEHDRMENGTYRIKDHIIKEISDEYNDFNGDVKLEVIKVNVFIDRAEILFRNHDLEDNSEPELLTIPITNKTTSIII